MSFLKPKDIIEEGDTVILYLTVNSMHAIETTPTIVNKKGETIEHVNDYRNICILLQFIS